MEMSEGRLQKVPARDALNGWVRIPAAMRGLAMLDRLMMG